MLKYMRHSKPVMLLVFSISLLLIAGCSASDEKEGSARYRLKSPVRRLATYDEMTEVFSGTVIVDTGPDVRDGYVARFRPDGSYEHDGFGGFSGKYEISGSSVCVSSERPQIHFCDEVYIGTNGPEMDRLRLEMPRS